VYALQHESFKLEVRNHVGVKTKTVLAENVRAFKNLLRPCGRKLLIARARNYGANVELPRLFLLIENDGLAFAVFFADSAHAFIEP
jgi:hypothetical protein